MTQTPNNFLSDASAVLSDLGESLRAAIAALPDRPAAAADLARSAGVSRKLAWQVWKMAHDGDLPGYPGGLPGPAALAGFARSAGEAGVPREVVVRIEDAVRGLENLTVLHSGDRASLYSMLRWASRPRKAGVDEAVRRQAFQTNSEIWGIQAQAVFQAIVLAPGTEAGRVDDLTLSGEIGIRRLRAGARYSMTGVGQRSAPGRGARWLAGDGPLIPEFSSAPAPFINAGTDAQGRSRLELMDAPVGREGEITFVLAEMFENAGRRFGTPERGMAHFTMHAQRPYGVYVCDLLVRRDLWSALEAQVRVYSAAEGYALDQASRREEDLLPIAAEVQDLGQGLGAAACEDLPRHQELIKWACGRVGWNPEQFRVHRLRLAYPPMPSTVVVSVTLPREGPA